MSNTTDTCLVIDDDEDFREALAAALRRREMTVYVAADGDAALALIGRTQVSHVVLDLRLVGDSGLELIAPILEAMPAVRIVVLTGYASIATAVQAIKLGAAHYLTKPADVEEILAAFSMELETPFSAVPTNPTPLSHIEWEHIQRTLLACEGNISEAARMLGLHRRTLQRKLRKRPSGL